MALEMMSGIPKGSISDVKKSPMDVFKMSAELSQGIYILNRNDIAGVVLDKNLYEAMAERIEALEEMVLEAEAYRRIQNYDSNKETKTYSLDELGIDLSDVEISEELKRLDGSQRVLINKSLKRIQLRGAQAGQPLKGNLAGCRKLKHKQAGLRVIFRESPVGIEIIQVIAIGKREDSQVYKIAEKRIR